MQKFLLSAILFFLVLISFSLFFFFYETQYFGSRASSALQFSASNSYVFLNPGRAQADGKEQIRMTIMILNENGMGVLGKKPVISVDPRITITTTQDTTNTMGEAKYEFASSIPGDFYVTITVDGVVVPQKAPLTFY